MRIWLIGAEQAGSEALRQLKKNPAVTVIVSDAVDRPKAVSDGVIAKVDMVENVTPVNINQLARRVRPDLILIDAGAARAPCAASAAASSLPKPCSPKSLPSANSPACYCSRSAGVNGGADKPDRNT